VCRAIEAYRGVTDQYQLEVTAEEGWCVGL
jgi:hypothetical protein